MMTTDMKKMFQMMQRTLSEMESKYEMGLNIFGQEKYKEGFQVGIRKSEEVDNSECDIENINWKSIQIFAKWCYVNGIDFSYMAKGTDTVPFTERVVSKFKRDMSNNYNGNIIKLKLHTEFGIPPHYAFGVFSSDKQQDTLADIQSTSYDMIQLNHMALTKLIDDGSIFNQLLDMTQVQSHTVAAKVVAISKNELSVIPNTEEYASMIHCFVNDGCYPIMRLSRKFDQDGTGKMRISKIVPVAFDWCKPEP